MGNFPQKVRKATCGFEPRGSFGVPLRAAATLMTFSSCARNQWGEGSPRPSSQCRVKRTASSANQAPPDGASRVPTLYWSFHNLRDIYLFTMKVMFYIL